MPTPGSVISSQSGEVNPVSLSFSNGTVEKRTVGGATTLTIGPIEVRNFKAASGELLLLYPNAMVRLEGGTAAFFHHDQVDSIQLITDAAGTVAATSTYQPFGEKRTDSAGILATETKGFVGERYDSSPELQYLNARYYDPALSLFTSPDWQNALWNSVRIAPVATLLSVVLGTLAAVGLSQPHVPFRGVIMAILISPMIVPLIISAAGMYFFYSRLGLQGTYWGVVLAHAVLGIPFVIITVTATLVGFDRSLVRAAANLGADPVTTFFKIQMPLILPGVISGALFAFITSFDEVVVVLFVGSASQKTLTWQMFIGLREQISPTILAVATILVTISVLLLTTLELLRRRSERMRGMSPG